MTGERLTRQMRLNGRAQFDRVFARPQRQSDRYFTVLARRNDCELVRLGLAVSKKVDKRAVGRNRIKRLIRESLRQSQTLLKGWDLVVLPKPSARHADNATLAKALDALWRRVNRANKPRRN